MLPRPLYTQETKRWRIILDTKFCASLVRSNEDQQDLLWVGEPPCWWKMRIIPDSHCRGRRHVVWEGLGRRRVPVAAPSEREEAPTAATVHEGRFSDMGDRMSKLSQNSSRGRKFCLRQPPDSTTTASIQFLEAGTSRHKATSRGSSLFLLGSDLVKLYFEPPLQHKPLETMHPWNQS